MGSLILVEGKFRPFAHATNPGEFDAADYYRVAGQQGRLMKAACLAESEGSSAFREGLYRVREYLALLLDACYPQEEASVMGAMLLGEKAMLDGDIKSLYQQNGIIHILAISGVKTLNLALPREAKKPENSAFLRVHRGKIYIKKWQF